MLTASRLLHFDAPCHHLSLSDIRVLGPRSNVYSAQTGHCKPCKSITALRGHFTGKYLPSFGSRKNAVLLTTFKQDVRYDQVSQLLSAVGHPLFSETDFRTAIHYSFVVVAAYAPSSGRPTGTLRACRAYAVAEPGLVDVDGMQLIGFTRAISDGAFTAQITDLVVHPRWQRQGIGRRLVEQLRWQSNSKGADGCIVFVKQSERMFFWKCGFRMSGKYRVMKPLFDEEI